MITVEAPGKLNLSLLVDPPRSDRYHPLDSLVQTIDWHDTLTIEPADERDDSLVVTGEELDAEENLIHKALREIRRDATVPPLSIDLAKNLPIAAGLGGGSSDAAATVMGVARFVGLPETNLAAIATRIGADVPLFLIGGSLRMQGVGDVVNPLEPITGFAVAVAVPSFPLSTVEVYQRWDQLEGPLGEPVPDRDAPPMLRGGMPLRNDLLPAALSLEPGLGDFMADVRSVWGRPVCLTGSGSACFGYFPTVDEARDAADAVVEKCAVARGVDLRDRGVEVV